MTLAQYSTHVPRLKQARTQDFDEQAGLLEGWQQHYAQLSSGHFTGAIVEVLFDDIHLFAESTNQALFQSGKLEDGLCAVGIPLHTGESGTFCGEAMRPDAAHIFSGSDGFEFYSPSRLTMGGIVAPQSVLPEWLLDRQPLKNKAHLKPVSHKILREAGEFLSLAFSLCNQYPALLQSEKFRRQMREGVVSCLIDILDDRQTSISSESLNKRWHIVRQTREYLHDAQDTAVEIETICRQLGVSRRTLQYSFQEQVGMNPVAYLRAQRLNAVRQMLKQGSSVTDAATAWGFWHFGHFSQEYKKLFGELPSDTLRRYGGEGGSATPGKIS
ncbi:MAG TPA: helix-turn-helix domain-containing protein [Gallionella sp.]|nr:helix-turn-helix domain-containing protein [Gallionella sp.]